MDVFGTATTAIYLNNLPHEQISGTTRFIRTGNVMQGTLDGCLTQDGG
jgi:hypothetical protein